MTTASTAINTPNEVLGEALNTADFIRPGFVLDFPDMLEFRKGKIYPVPAGLPAPGLTDPGFILSAGYVHNQPSPSDPPYVPPGQSYPGFSWLSAELAPYPNRDAIEASGYSPFSVADGILTIAAAPTPAQVLPWLPAGYSQSFISGAFCSFPFSQQYGYWEAKLKVPSGRGLWPAFWLLPTDLSWPPEIDILEILGQTPNTLYTTAHDPAYKTATDASTQIGYGTAGAVDLSQAFHTYGCDWGPDKLCFYLDRQLVFSVPTPANMHKPFYFNVNLAVGGPASWPGAPDGATVFPAKMEVAYVQVWQREAYSAAG